MRDKWSDRQRRIYEGLSSIGQEVAGFYEAGLQIIYGQCQIKNAANFLLHAAREIDGGLRDILAADFQPVESEKEKHKKSIFFSLGSDEFKELAEEWHKATSELHKYAHRHGAWKEPRQLDSVISIWSKYEFILYRLVGSYFSIIERIKRISEIRNLERDGVVDTLSNMLTIPAYYNFFFLNEKDARWFSHLKCRGYFTPDNIAFDKQGAPLTGYAINYLARVSEQTALSPRDGKDLIEIIDSLVQFSLKVKVVSNYNIWWCCVIILNNLPNKIIKEHLGVKEFRLWLPLWTDNSLGPITDIGDKLLPKFLNDDSTGSYAEAVIDAITQVKASERPNAFLNREEAAFVWDYYWIRDAFRKNSQLICHKCSSKVILVLADKLKKALEYKLRQADTNIEIGQDIYQVAVSRIPVEGTKPKEIDFKDGQYECSAKKYSSDQLKDLERHKAYPAIINTDPQIQLARFSLSAVNRNDMASAIKQNLPAEINWAGNANIIEKIEYLYDGLFSDYSYIRIKSLATGTRDYESGVEEVLTIILRDTLLAKCESNRDVGREILEAFLSDQYKFPVFRRLALLCVDKFWTDYTGLMDRFFGLYPNALAKLDFEVEMYDVLRNHNSGFAPALKVKLKELINTAPEYSVETDDKHIAHLKCLWLSPLRDNPEFSALYEEAAQKAGLEARAPYKPERSSDFKTVDVVHKSSISKEDIMQKSIGELVKYLQEFKGADFWHRTFENEPDEEGLANTLQAAVRENPKKFTDKLGVFLDVDDFYIRHLLRGIKEAWDDNCDSDSGEIARPEAAGRATGGGP